MKGKTNAVSGGNGMPTEKVNITLSLNQPSASDLLGAKITLAYGAYSKEYIWEGRALTLEIPEYVIYTLSFSNVEGYATPSMLEFEAVGDNVRQIDALYQSELIVVTATADSGVSVAGQQVTINGVATTLDATGEVSQKIPYGTAYSVSFNDMAGYDAPVIQSFTASQPTRYVTVVYKEKKLGAFIQDTNGKLWTADVWDGSATPNGIAVITSSMSFVIALKRGGNKTIADEKYYAGMTLPAYSTSDAAFNNISGVSNTSAMVSAFGGSGAAAYCADFTFPNGKKGYLGSAGEWRAALDNKDAITSCLSKVGGTKMDDMHWTSTRSTDQYSQNRFWAFSWAEGYWIGYYLTYSCIARAFTTL